MGRERYPLTTLQRVRENATREASHELAIAVERRAQCETHRADQERALHLHAEQAERLRQELHAELTSGLLQARELAQENAWGTGVELRQAHLDAAAEEARAIESDATKVEQQTRSALLECARQERLVQIHHEQWKMDRRAIEENQEELAREEAWRRGGV